MFDPLDEGAIENSLRMLLTDADLRANYAKRGLKRCKEFSWQKAAAQTIDVFREAVEEAG